MPLLELDRARVDGGRCRCDDASSVWQRRSVVHAAFCDLGRNRRPRRQEPLAALGNAEQPLGEAHPSEPLDRGRPGLFMFQTSATRAEVLGGVRSRAPRPTDELAAAIWTGVARGGCAIATPGAFVATDPCLAVRGQLRTASFTSIAHLEAHVSPRRRLATSAAVAPSTGMARRCPVLTSRFSASM